MISKSRWHVSVISLDSFHPSYPARICVHCLDESIALGLEKGNILFVSLTAPSGTAGNCHRHVVHICMHFRHHVVAAFVRLNI